MGHNLFRCVWVLGLQAKGPDIYSLFESVGENRGYLWLLSNLMIVSCSLPVWILYPEGWDRVLKLAVIVQLTRA